MDSTAQSVNQPRSLITLAFGEFWERLSYYGAQTILVLYLTKYFSFSDISSYSIYGAYAALAYAMPVLGGIVADHLLGYRRAIILGAILIIVGNICLAIPTLQFFCLGLAISVCGIGLYKPNTTSLVGDLYHNNHSDKERGFTLFYVIYNVGATLGPIIYGITAEFWGWHSGFLLSAFGILVAFIILLRQKELVNMGAPPNPEFFRTYWLPGISGQTLVLVSIGVVCAALSVLFFHPKGVGYLVIAFVILAIATIITGAWRQPKMERNRVWVLLILCFCCVFFFMASLQTASSVSLFINRDVNRTLWGWEIPTIMFSSLYPFFVIVTAPILVWMWKKSTQQQLLSLLKIVAGMLLGSLGFIFFSLAAFMSSKYFSSHAPLLFIILGNVCLGAGEVCLVPAILTAMSSLAPARMQGTMVGVLFLSLACGGYLSGVLAKWSINAVAVLTSGATSAEYYGLAFLKIAGLIGVVAVLIFAISPWLRKMVNNA